MSRSRLSMRTGSRRLLTLPALVAFAACSSPAGVTSQPGGSDPSNTSHGQTGSGTGGGSSISGDAGTPAVNLCAAALGFRVSATSTTSVDLAWGAGAASSRIRRKTLCGTDAYQAITTSATETSFNDTTVQADWAYWYELTLTDASGHAVSQTVATQAASTPVPSCSGGAPPQPAGADAASCLPGDAGVTPDASSASDAGGSPDASELPPDAGSPVSGDAGAACQAPVAAGTDVTKAPYNVANNGSETTAVLQSALTALAAAGKAAYFPAGTYLITSTVNVPAGSTLNSDVGAKIQIATGFASTFMFSTTGSPVTINGLTFDGAGLPVSALALNPGDGYSIINNTFQNSLTDTSSYTGELTFYGMSTGSNVSHNAFLNIGPSSYTAADIQNDYAPTGIYIDVAANVVDTTLDDNLFEVVGEAIHGPSSSGTVHMNSTNLEIARNVLTHIHRITIEIQGGGSNLKILDNYVGSYNNPYWGSFGLSIAAPSTANVLIKGNMLNGVSTDPITGFWGYGLEAGGYPVTVTGNYVYGFAGQPSSVGLISAHHTTANNFVSGNTFCGTAGDGAFYENPSTASGNWEAPSPGDVLSPNTSIASCSSAPAQPGPSPVAGPCKP